MQAKHEGRCKISTLQLKCMKNGICDSASIESVDEFLYHYTPHMVHIQEFIRSHDENPTEAAEAGCPEIGTSFSCNDSSDGLPRIKSNSSNPNKPASNVYKSLSLVAVDQQSGLWSNQRTRREYKKMSPEGRVQRRRDQNKEAQRRYREKQMLLICQGH